MLVIKENKYNFGRKANTDLKELQPTCCSLQSLLHMSGFTFCLENKLWKSSQPCETLPQDLDFGLFFIECKVTLGDLSLFEVASSFYFYAKGKRKGKKIQIRREQATNRPHTICFLNHDCFKQEMLSTHISFPAAKVEAVFKHGYTIS